MGRFQDIELEIKGKIGVIKFNRPKVSLSFY